MPELPEVETTRRGIEPYLVNQRINDVIVRDSRLRWPVSVELQDSLRGQIIHSVERRAKYILIRADSGCVIVHLGMSGSLRVVDSASIPRPHDHIDLVPQSGKALRMHDPRRFGCMLWTRDDPLTHTLLLRLGPEPLTDAFNGEYLHDACSGRKIAIKNLIMNSQIVAGVGNIYASEALFLAGIHPQRAASRISYSRLERLAETIKQVLTQALESGGTTLRDFVREDGNPGYFRQKLNVYERTGMACSRCGEPIRKRVLGQRSTFYCSGCQH